MLDQAPTSTDRKIANFKALYSQMLQDGFIINTYMDTHLPHHPLCSVIGQVGTSSHQLEIEIDKYATKLYENGSTNCPIRGWNWKKSVSHVLFL